MIHMSIEGNFGTRAAAADALRDAAALVESGAWQATQPSEANPLVFITQVYDENDET